MSLKVQTLRAGYRLVLETSTEGSVKLGHVLGDYVIGFTTYDHTGQQISRMGQYHSPEDAYKALTDLSRTLTPMATPPPLGWEQDLANYDVGGRHR